MRKSEFSKGDNLTVFGAATEPIPVSPKRATEVLVVLTIMVIAMGGMIRIYDAGESVQTGPHVSEHLALISQKRNRASGGMKILMRLIQGVLDIGIQLLRFSLSGSTGY